MIREKFGLDCILDVCLGVNQSQPLKKIVVHSYHPERNLATLKVVGQGYRIILYKDLKVLT